MTSPDADDIWLPLVDEPIGGIVQEVEREHPEIARLVASPRRLLAFRTFAYIRVGIVLGQLLVDEEEPIDGESSWVDEFLREPAHRARIVEELRAVASEIAADARYAADDEIGPDAAARERFRRFARKALED